MKLCRSKIFRNKLRWPVYVFFIIVSVIPKLSGIVRHTSLLGKKVTLACNVTPSVFNDSLNLVLWYKDNSQHPLYSLDARLNTSLTANHVVHDAVRGRAFFNMISDLAFLEINDVKQEDGGVYTCRVDFKRSKTILYEVELIVIVPPPKPTIIDRSSWKVTDSIIDHYNEGDTVRLRCQVTRGNPTPEIIWLKDGYIFDNEFQVAPNGTVYNDLTIESISRDLYHQQIVCRASNNNITLPSKTVVKAVFNLYPLKTLITTLQRPLTADRKIRMTCKTSGSKPPAVIRWFKENEHLKKVKQTEDNGTTVSVLTFTPTASDNGNKLLCVAINPTIPGKKVEDSRKLNIFYTPVVRIRLGKEFNQDSVIEGKSMYIECVVDSNPRPIHFDWFYNTIRLETNKSTGIIVANRTLILQRLKAYHRGNYSCAAVNQIGQGESLSIFLNVKRVPESVSNCTVDRDMSSLYVNCAEGNDGGLQQSFMMEVIREDDDQLLANVSALIKPQFTINFNTMDNNVIINVYAFNYKGRSASCTLSVRALVGNKRLFGIVHLSLVNPITGGMICVGAILILTAVIIFILMMKRRRQMQENDRRKLYQKKKIGQSQSAGGTGSCVETQTPSTIYADDCSESEKISPDIIPPSQQRVDDEGSDLEMLTTVPVSISETISKKVSFHEDPEISFVEVDIPPIKDVYSKHPYTRRYHSTTQSEKWLGLNVNNAYCRQQQIRTFSESEV